MSNRRFLAALSAAHLMLAAVSVHARPKKVEPRWRTVPELTPNACDYSGPESDHLSDKQKQEFARTCKAAEEFRAFVVERQTCEGDRDCAVVATYCPFGCGVPVAKKSATEVAKKYEELSTKLGEDCKYRCHLVVRSKCMKRRCVAAD